MNNIHEKCEGCKRINDEKDCEVYVKPIIWWQEDNKYKEYCPLATHLEFEGDEVNKKIRVGQQKQRKKI